MGKNKDKFDFDSGSIFKFIFSKWKLLAIVSITAFIVSAIVSFVIKPKFKASIVLFPTSSISVSKSLMNTSYYTSKGDILTFGEEEECDQLLQVLLSREMKDLMNAKYNLMAHYGINPSKTYYPLEEYYSTFEDNFSFRRTEYMSVKVTVYDTDAKLAAYMADDVAAFADSIFIKMRRERALKSFDLAKTQYVRFDSIINTITDSLQKLSNLGIFDYEYQNRELTKAYYRALEKNKTDVADKIKKKMDIVSKYGIGYAELIDQLNYQVAQRTSMFYKLSEAEAELTQKLPNVFVVESAKPSEKKAYPRRTIIVFTSTIAAFFLTLVLSVFVDSIKKHL